MESKQVVIPLGDTIGTTSRRDLEARVVPQLWNVTTERLDSLAGVEVMLQILGILGRSMTVNEQFLKA